MWHIVLEAIEMAVLWESWISPAAGPTIQAGWGPSSLIYGIKIFPAIAALIIIVKPGNHM